MEFFPRRIVVKSTNEMFELEKSGVKNNTVRVILDDAEGRDMARFFGTYKRNIENGNMVEFICQIRNSETGEAIERVITNIVDVDLGLYVRDENTKMQELGIDDEKKYKGLDVLCFIAAKERDVLDEFKRRNIYIISFK